MDMGTTILMVGVSFALGLASGLSLGLHWARKHFRMFLGSVE